MQGEKDRFARARERAAKTLVARRNYKSPDFHRMLLDLRNLGWSCQCIAHVVGMKSQGAVSKWLDGASPRYENGFFLIALWQEQTGLERIPLKGEHLTYRYELKKTTTDH